MICDLLACATSSQPASPRLLVTGTGGWVESLLHLSSCRLRPTVLSATSGMAAAAGVLTNFCLEPFVTGVSSTSVTADGHSPSNLVAMRTSVWSRGFRVERYVRPPVCVEVVLEVPVTLACVLVCLDVVPGTEVRLELCVPSGGESVWQGGVVGESEAVVLAVKNPRMWERGAQSSLLSAGPVLGSCVTLSEPQVQDFWMRGGPGLAQVRQVCLKINRWTGIRPVGLKWLEIWGWLARSSSPYERDRYRRACREVETRSKTAVSPALPLLFQSSEKEPEVEATEAPRSSPSNHRGKGHLGRGRVSAGQNVPPQLLDEITFEVMEMPMVLPSGRCVDRSTLDKLAATDAACGRPPTDPFTGLPFSEQCRPRFSVHVKRQLDERLASTSSQGQGYEVKRPRTLGSSSQILAHHCHTDPNLQSEYPDWRQKWSLSNQTPIAPTLAACGRIEPSPLDKTLTAHLLNPHPLPTTSVTTSKHTIPVAEPLTNTATATCSPNVHQIHQTTSSLSVDVHQIHQTASSLSADDHQIHQAASSSSADVHQLHQTAAGSFDCKVERSLDCALQDIFGHPS